MVEEVRFVGKVRHTEETIRLLFKTEYYTYDKLRIVVRMALGCVLAVSAFLLPMNRILQAVLLMAGCWLLVCKDFPASIRAERTLEARGTALPENICTFFDEGMDLDGEGHMRLEYERFHRLVEDEGYLYLFLDRRSVCMIDKQSVEHGTAGELKEFVENKTGLPWTKNRSLLWMNLSDIRQAIRDWRQR